MSTKTYILLNLSLVFYLTVYNEFSEDVLMAMS